MLIRQIVEGVLNFIFIGIAVILGGCLITLWFRPADNYSWVIYGLISFGCLLYTFFGLIVPYLISYDELSFTQFFSRIERDLGCFALGCLFWAPVFLIVGHSVNAATSQCWAWAFFVSSIHVIYMIPACRLIGFGINSLRSSLGFLPEQKHRVFIGISIGMLLIGLSLVVCNYLMWYKVCDLQSDVSSWLSRPVTTGK